MQQNLTIEKRTFKSKDGSNVDYVSLTFNLNGETFRLKPADTDKNLLNYLLENIPDFGKKPFNLPLEITKEQFTPDKGVPIDYYAYTLKLGRKEVKLKPHAEDKRLLTYLLNLAK